MQTIEKEALSFLNERCPINGFGMPTDLKGDYMTLGQLCDLLVSFVKSFQLSPKIDAIDFLKDKLNKGEIPQSVYNKQCVKLLEDFVAINYGYIIDRTNNIVPEDVHICFAKNKVSLRHYSSIVCSCCAGGKNINLKMIPEEAKKLKKFIQLYNNK